MLEAFKLFLLKIVSLLPDSPFAEFVEGIEVSYFKHINWFIPLDICANLTLAWVDCLLVYIVVCLVSKILGTVAKGFIQSLAQFLFV